MNQRKQPTNGVAKLLIKALKIVIKNTPKDKYFSKDIAKAKELIRVSKVLKIK